MRDYVIITDSTTDLSQQMINDLEIEVIPLGFSVENESFLNYSDNRDMLPEDFYRLMRDGKTIKTAQINIATFLSAFEKRLQENKDIFCVTLSSGISGTYNSAMAAANELRKKYKDNKIIVIDSKSASLGEGMLVYNAVMKKREGLSIDELEVWIEGNKNKLCHWFTVDDLMHLKRGGRISATAAAFGTLLNIKPVLHVDDAGHLVPVKKVRGRKSSLLELINMMEKTGINLDGQKIFISHGDCVDDAEFVAGTIRQKFNIGDVIINYVGPVIGAHSGPGTVALFFWGSHR